MKTARILEGKPYTGNWNVTIGKRFALLAGFAFVLGAQGDYVWNGGSAGSGWTAGSLWMVGDAASAWVDGNAAVFENAGDAFEQSSYYVEPSQDDDDSDSSIFDSWDSFDTDWDSDW